MACSVPMPVGVLTGTAFTDPPCTDGEPVLALAGGDPKDNVKDHKIYNPVTGRYVLKHTPLGKKLVACPKDKIYNPVTGRYVLKHTPLGKKLVACPKDKIYNR